MHEDEDDDRFEAALRVAEDDPVRGAAALRSIVADAAFDPDTRFEAAARLAEVDEAQAADALRSIVADDVFDPATAPKRQRDWLKSAVDHQEAPSRAGPFRRAPRVLLTRPTGVAEPGDTEYQAVFDLAR